MGDEERLVDILRHSLILTSIVRNDESGSYEPTGFGRGCLYVENGVTYLFTVRHLLDDSNNEQIGVLLTVADERRAVFSLQPFNHFDLFHMSDDGVFKKGAEGKGIDFFWRRAASNEEFDYFEWKDDDKVQLERRGKIEAFHSISLPTLDGVYFFGGTVGHWMDDYNKRIEGEFVQYACEYQKECLDDMYYMFSFAEPVDSSLLRGLSGSPIFDEDHNLVSLVVSGYEGRNDVVYGLNLDRAMSLLRIQEQI